MGRSIDMLESDRIVIQDSLDAAKTQNERNKLGQFATPPTLAREILTHAKGLAADHPKIRFLDPAIGTGSFYSALRQVFTSNEVTAAVGYEIDRHYGQPAIELWKDSRLDLRIADFTSVDPDDEYNLIICNPPYVRHHHLTNQEKNRLRDRSRVASGCRLSGLAGLYCHFITLSHAWLSRGGVAGWLVPSEFMDVNYGQELRRYLLESVTLLQIHRFDPNDVKFADALVSSSVVWYKKSPPPPQHKVRFTYGGSLASPTIDKVIPALDLVQEQKWTRFPRFSSRNANRGPVIGDLFTIKRGVATGSNAFFILTEEKIERWELPKHCFRPILPSPRFLDTNEIHADEHGLPFIDRRLYLLDTQLPEAVIERRHPRLWEYLEAGRASGVSEGYLCRHRSPWYAQEVREPAPIVCTYIGRCGTRSGRPFRFILNASNATIANVYLAMYPTRTFQRLLDADQGLMRKVWNALNALDIDDLLGEGRVYGGGLHKLEPKELANVSIPSLANLITKHPPRQALLFAALNTD